MKISLKALSVVLALICLFVASFYALGIPPLEWTEPTEGYPDGNIALPLNVSSSGQTKEGGLILNTGGAENGLIVDKGNVGIGTTEPSQKLDVAGNIKANQMCIGTSCRDAWFDGAKMRKTAGQYFAKGSAVKITLNDVEFSAGNSVTADTANSRLTINETGYYLVITSWYCSGISNTNEAFVYIYKNGASAFNAKDAPGYSGNAAFAQATNMLYLSEGDYIEMYVMVSGTGSGITTSTSDNLSPKMSVTRVY